MHMHAAGRAWRDPESVAPVHAVSMNENCLRSRSTLYHDDFLSIILRTRMSYPGRSSDLESEGLELEA